MTLGAGGSDPPQDPPPPKRRRRPPPGLEGFDTGITEEEYAAAERSTPAERSAPVAGAPMPAERSAPVAGAPTPAERSAPVAAAPTPAERSTSTIAPSAGTPAERSTSTTAPSAGMPAVPSATIAGELTKPSGPVAATTPTPIPGELAVHARGVGTLATGAEPAAPAIGEPGAPEPGDGVPAPEPSTPSAAARVTSGATRRPDAEPLVPSTFSAGELRHALGGSTTRRHARPPTGDDRRDDDDDDLPGTPRNRKLIVVGALAAVAGLAIAATIFIGHQNSGWFYLTCESDRIVAEQGRAFPPWGSEALEGKAWAPIKIPPEAECTALETESYPSLVQQYRDMLVKRASVLLTAKEITSVDEASALLEQALLHARSSSDAARDARTDIQRLLGDVGYWRASLKLRDAANNLRDAAKEFDAAALQRPRHVTDAAAWAEYVRKVIGELEAGPSGSTQTAFPPSPPPTSERPLAPPGVALPVEPDAAGSAAAELPPPVTPDAGLPTGGVLL